MATEQIVQRILVISTAHITESLARTMDSQRDYAVPGAGLGFVYNYVEYGYLIRSVSKDYPHMIPKCIKDIWTLAKKLKCSYVLLDCDADLHPDLEAYDW